MHTRRASAVATALVLLLLALAPHGASEHPESEGPCPDYSQYIPEDSLEGTYPVYIAIDEVNSGYLWSIWIYAESNGQQGLQRDDYFCYTPGTTEDTRDTIIF